jgi:hypothetical protein
MTYAQQVLICALVAVSGAAAVPVHPAAAPSPNGHPAWARHLREADAAARRADRAGVERALRDAYRAALPGYAWQGMAAVGDASRRLAEAGVARDAMVARARQAYLMALIRARQTASIDGALRAGEAFAALGDRDMAVQSLRVAAELASRRDDAAARARVQAFAERLDEHDVATGETAP